MTQVSIDGVHRISFLLVSAHLIRRTIVESIVSRKCITVIRFGVQSPFQAGLEVGTGSFATASQLRMQWVARSTTVRT